ncbi:MAG: PEP-CTERM sorting domain-containing protein [Armatimonadetes bacterium]|nr:PEP-CTERM sorting domain-containing protein [Armatimonadota bacterium]
MKKITCIVALACSALSFGSFDLMYLPDVSGTKVHRFDPVNRVYLGSISTPTARQVAASSASPYIFVSNGITPLGLGALYEGSTGNYINSGTNGYASPSFSETGSDVWALGSTTTVRKNSLPTLNSAGQFSVTGYTEIFGLAPVGNNVAVVGAATNGDILFSLYSTTGTSLATRVMSTAATVAANPCLRGMALSVALDGTAHLAFANRTNTGTVKLNSILVNGATLGSNFSFTLTGFSTASVGNASVMAAHNGTFYVAGADATTPTLTRIQHWNLATVSITLADYTTNSLSVPSTVQWSGATFLAPEPGSMVGIGVGLLVLLRRRRA